MSESGRKSQTMHKIRDGVVRKKEYNLLFIRVLK